MPITKGAVGKSQTSPIEGKNGVVDGWPNLWYLFPEMGIDQLTVFIWRLEPKLLGPHSLSLRLCAGPC